jgi:hypothetical protein
MRDQALNVPNQEPLPSSIRPSSHVPSVPLTAAVALPPYHATERSPENMGEIPYIKYLAPNKGPKRGGPLIMFDGKHFPSDRKIYIRFGSSSTLARFGESSNVLHCNLPSSTVVGKVPVTLLEEDLVTLMGTSCCSFLYEDDDDLELYVPRHLKTA